MTWVETKSENRLWATGNDGFAVIEGKKLLITSDHGTGAWPLLDFADLIKFVRAELDGGDKSPAPEPPNKEERI